MDEQTTPQSSGNSMGKLLLPVVVIGLIVIAVVAYYVMGQNKQESAQAPENAMQAVTSAPTTAAEGPTGTEGAMAASEYKDGSYSAEGDYVSPGGPRQVDVTITVKDNVVTEATFEGLATDATSKRFQTEFAENFEPMVVGKNIDDISLTKVSGSSLTPKGFMDALEKVKTEAQS